MLFSLALLLVPLGLAWQVVWTVRHGKLPAIMLLPGLTRHEMPIPFWLFVVGLSFTTTVAAALSAVFILAALQAWLSA